MYYSSIDIYIENVRNLSDMRAAQWLYLCSR